MYLQSILESKGTSAIFKLDLLSCFHELKYLFLKYLFL